MAQLAIRGHATRGKEVIKILEMLGGKNTTNLHGECDNMIYIINSSYYGEIIYMLYRTDGYVVFTLEEFLEKYPYKVGDKIVVKGLSEYPKSIHFMKWFDDNIHYSFDNETWFLPSALNPYKEETMEDNIIDTVKESDNRYRIVLNHQFDMEVDEGEYYAVRRKPKYPKTYKECHELMVQWKEYDCNPNSELIFCDAPIHDFCKIIVARNLYWKIAGEQMGLDKPWEPNWEDDTAKYNIFAYKNHISFDVSIHAHKILVFPTKEIRDIFYNNFTELIERCKELL